MAGGFKDLKAWQKRMDLVEEVYALCERLPENERFGLSDQMRRAAVSVPSNIAEGHGRQSNLDFKRFLRIAMGSTRELETQLLLTTRLGFVSLEQAKPSLRLIDDVAKMLWGLMKSDLSISRNAATDRSRPSTADLTASAE